MGSYETDITTGKANKADVSFERLGDTPSGSVPIGYNTNLGGWSAESTQIKRHTSYNRHAPWLKHTKEVHYRNRLTIVDFVQPLGIAWMSPRGQMYLDNFGREVFGHSLLGHMQNFSPSNYIVQPGDTYEQIASRTVGDRRFASSIAAYNGRSALNDVLLPGQLLRIPQYIAVTNQWNQNTPYSVLMSILLDNLSPYIKNPQIKHHNYQAIALFISVTVAVIAAIYLGPQAAAAIQAGSSYLLTAAITAIIGATLAAITDAELQGVMLITGLEDRFNWKYVEEAGIMGAQAGFVYLEAAWIGPGGITSLKQIGEAILISGAADVTSQLLEMEAGLRDHFDARELFTSMVVAMVDAGLDYGISHSTTATHLMKDPVISELDHLGMSVANGMISGAITGRKPSAADLLRMNGDSHAFMRLFLN